MEKYYLFFILITAMLFIFSACSKTSSNEKSKQPDVTAIKDEILKQIEFEQEDELVSATPENILLMYDLEVETFDSYSIFYAGSGGSADEIAIIKAKSKDDVSKIEDVMKKRVSDRIKAFQGYAPRESEKLKNSVIKVKNNYILLAICNDSDKVGQIFVSSFN